MNKLYVFMGYPGCGKSYIAKQLATKTTDLYLSSDELREEMFGFRDQTRNDELFAELYKRALDHIDIGDTYIDATNLSRKDRLRILAQIKRRYELHLICVIRPIDEIIETNNIRQGEEHIPEDILKRILGKFQLPILEEGWDYIDYYFNTTKFSPTESIFHYLDFPDINHDNPHHNETLHEHLHYITQMSLQLSDNKYVQNIAPYHDIGKFFVKKYNPDKGYHQFIGHAPVSAYIYLTNTIIRYMYDNHIVFGFIPDIEKCIGNYDFIVMYFGIYYHDIPYSLPDRKDIIKSISKPSKHIVQSFRRYCKKHSIEELVDIILEFNKIDSMREGEIDG